MTTLTLLTQVMTTRVSYNPERNAYTVRFNADGTRMYIVGTYWNRVFQYDLSTAWDVSTTSSSTVNFILGNGESGTVGLAFNTDGTKMYMTGGATDKVWEYDLSTGFDISTASYNGSNVSVSGTHSSPNDITFSNDGTKMYIVGATADNISQYDLTTGFDVTTATYSGNQISTGSTTPAATAPYGLAWNNNGTKMYLTGTSSDTVHEYDLTTGFDLSTATLSGNTYLSSHDPISICFRPDGRKMYLLSWADDKVHQYSV
jgi:sugar lactone lactonase YvrE